MEMRQTRKHLNILYNLTTILLTISIIGSILTFFAMIAGEGSLPFIICTSVSVSLYISTVLLSAIIDIYNAVVPETGMLDADNSDIINSSKQ